MPIELKKDVEKQLAGSIGRFFKEELGDVRHEPEFDYWRKKKP